LVALDTRVQIISQVVNNLEQYSVQQPLEENYSFSRVQNVLYLIKLATEAFQYQLLEEQQLSLCTRIFVVLFNLRIDIKYFWKKLSYNPNTFQISLASDQQPNEVFNELSVHGKLIMDFKISRRKLEKLK
jgi:hypothetical protein